MLEIDDACIGETDETLSWETEEFKKGYQNAIMQFKKRYNLRSKESSTKPQHTETSDGHPFHKLTEAEKCD